jgi:uncharacterized protein
MTRSRLIEAKGALRIHDGEGIATGVCDMANKHGDFIWYELLTSDADAAQVFYSGIFGWSHRDSGQKPMDYRLLSIGGVDVGGLMQITGEMKAGGARPIWLGYIAVDDVDKCVASIIKSGGKIQMPAMDLANVGRIAMLTDPQGAPFYVMRGASNQVSQAFAFDKPRLGHCAWNELATSDRPGAMKFYADQFGWKKDGEMAMGDEEAYEFFRRADTPGMFAGVMTRPKDMPLSLWTFYFRVADVDEAVSRSKSHGGQIAHGPIQIPGGEYAVNAVDPQGAMFAFVGPRK